VRENVQEFFSEMATKLGFDKSDAEHWQKVTTTQLQTHKVKIHFLILAQLKLGFLLLWFI